MRDSNKKQEEIQIKNREVKINKMQINKHVNKHIEHLAFLTYETLQNKQNEIKNDFCDIEQSKKQEVDQTDTIKIKD